MERAIAVVSGGMDSVTMAHKLHHDYPEAQLHMLSFDYGQRHSRELAYAGLCAHDLGAQLTVIKMHYSLTQILAKASSSLVNRDVEVPHGHYEEESMKATVVPNRNAMMISMATAVAVAEGAEMVALGIHAGDHAIYPDCRPPFFIAMNKAMVFGTEGFADSNFCLYAPFLLKAKSDIVSEGEHLGVDWKKTWSCYEGDTVHCGECGTCVERREAFSIAGVVDPTEYKTSSVKL